MNGGVALPDGADGVSWGLRVMSEMENCSKKLPLDHGECPASHRGDALHFFPRVFKYREQDVLSPLSPSIS